MTSKDLAKDVISRIEDKIEYYKNMDRREKMEIMKFKCQRLMPSKGDLEILMKKEEIEDAEDITMFMPFDDYKDTFERILAKSIQNNKIYINSSNDVNVVAEQIFKELFDYVDIDSMAGESDDVAKYNELSEVIDNRIIHGCVIDALSDVMG